MNIYVLYANEFLECKIMKYMESDIYYLKATVCYY